MARDCNKGKVIGIVINSYYNYNLHLLNYNKPAPHSFATRVTWMLRNMDYLIVASLAGAPGEMYVCS